MSIAGFPTSSDIYLEVNGVKAAVVQSYTAKSSRTSQTVELGETSRWPPYRPTYPRHRTDRLTPPMSHPGRAELPCAGGLQPGHLQAGPEDHLLQLPVERHPGDRDPGRYVLEKVTIVAGKRLETEV